MFLNLAAWLMGTKAGRIVIAIGVTTILVGLALLRAYGKGVAAQKASQQAEALENLRHRVTVDDQVSKMGSAARRNELRRWMSNDEGM